MPFSVVGSSFVLFSEGTCEKVRQQNMRKWLTSGFFPVNISSWVFLPKARWGLLFWRYTIVVHALEQRKKGRLWSWIMALVALKLALFFLSATPFCRHWEGGWISVQPILTFSQFIRVSYQFINSYHKHFIDIFQIIIHKSKALRSSETRQTQHNVIL